MTKEALTLALEALEAAYARLVTKCEQNLVTFNGVDVDTLTLSQEAITAIKEALAQPEQEPVAWKPDRSGKYLTVVYRDVIPGDEVGAIVDHPKCVIMSWSNAVHDVEQLKNTTPPQRTWVGLTDEERNSLYEAHHDKYNLPNQGSPDGMDYERAIEAKLKEKNT